MQDLDKFKNEMNLSGKNVYVGHRYVPKIFGEWDNTKIYEPLSIVQYQGASYTSRQSVPAGVEITNDDYWAVTGNYNAQVEQYRQDVVQYQNEVNNFKDDLNAKNEALREKYDGFGLDPIDFGAVGDGITDDTTALQEVINVAIETNQSILINKVFKIDGTLMIDKPFSNRKAIIFHGVGGFKKENAGFLFSSNIAPVNNGQQSGDVRFELISFYSVNNARTIIFDTKRLIRMYFQSNDFIDVDHLIYEDTNPPYAQTVYLNNVAVTGGGSLEFVKVNNAYDFSFTHSVFEHREGGFANVGTFNSGRIVDSVIEGIGDYVLKTNGGRNTTIRDNYFEQCSRITHAPYISFNHPNTDFSTVIEGNLFQDVGKSNNDPNFYMVYFHHLTKGVKVGGNSSDTNLYKVAASHTIQNNFLLQLNTERLYKAPENPNADNLYVVNNYKPFENIEFGNGNILPKWQTPFAGVDTHINVDWLHELESASINSYIGFDSKSQLILQATNEPTNLVGVQSDNFRIHNYGNYVLGIETIPQFKGVEGVNLKLEIVSVSSGLTVWEHLINFKGANYLQSVVIPTFHSLPSFTVDTGDYYLVVKLENEGQLIPINKKITITNLYIQSGTLANPSYKQS